MTIYRVTIRRLACDLPGCGREIKGEPDASNVKLRAMARRSGWVYVPGHPAMGSNADYCCVAHRDDARGGSR